MARPYTHMHVLWRLLGDVLHTFGSTEILSALNLHHSTPRGNWSSIGNIDITRNYKRQYISLSYKFFWYQWCRCTLDAIRGCHGPVPRQIWHRQHHTHVEVDQQLHDMIPPHFCADLCGRSGHLHGPAWGLCAQYSCPQVLTPQNPKYGPRLGLIFGHVGGL